MSALFYDGTDLKLLIGLGLLAGLGLYLVVTGLPWGKPRPDLASQLERLDIRARLREEALPPPATPLFRIPVLQAILAPVIDDLGGLLLALFTGFGLRGKDLERRLLLSGTGMTPAQFFGQKIGAALVLCALFPAMNALGIHPFGP